MRLKDPIGFKEQFPIAQYQIGEFRNFLYVFMDWSAKEAAIIDLHAGFEAVLEDLNRHSFKILTLLLTHSHWDHIGGLEKFVRQVPDARIAVHSGDVHRLPKAALIRERVSPVDEGQRIRIGSLQLEVLHTPGHSAGECCYLSRDEIDWPVTPSTNSTPHRGKALFTGDTLFVRDCGRTDLETGSVPEMFGTLQRLRGLPPETVILPGHWYQPECVSTIGDERSDNVALNCRSVEELAALP